jgi:cyclic pyranopterin phosphate synthase
MADISGKESTLREAYASVKVILNPDTYLSAKENKSAKGDIFTAAQIAGIAGAKKTSELIPLCHNIALNEIKVDFKLDDDNHEIRINAAVKSYSATGAEMEALTACSVAALTIYDMLKAKQRDIVITTLMLLEKKGGKSGDYYR